MKGKEKSAGVPLQQEQGIGAFASKCQPQPLEGEDDKWRDWTLVVCWQKIYEYVERFDSGLVRNISTELYHVLIMLTRGRAQRLVLKAAEPEGWKRTAFFSDDTNQRQQS